MLGVAVFAIDLDGYQPGAPYQQTVSFDVPGCVATYRAGSYWFSDCPPIGYKSPWRPTLQVTGPLGRPLAGVLVRAQLSNATTCVASQATTDLQGHATLEFPVQATGWFVLSGVALRGGLELARMGVSSAASLPRINAQTTAQGGGGFWNTIGSLWDWITRLF